MVVFGLYHDIAYAILPHMRWGVEQGVVAAGFRRDCRLADLYVASRWDGGGSLGVQSLSEFAQDDRHTEGY